LAPEPSSPPDPQAPEPAEPVWCAVANIVEKRPYGHDGAEERAGTKHFSPGTKVHIRHVFWGMGGEQVEVVARHRGSSRVVTMVIRSTWLTQWRVKLAYDPKIAARLRAIPDEAGSSSDGARAWDGTPESRERAKQIVRAFLPDSEMEKNGSPQRR
jgi:hypothetical protein